MERKKDDAPAQDETRGLDDLSIASPSGGPADHVSATGDDETEDGLNETDEAIRHGAEDIPAAERRGELPVFERGEALPKTD